MPIQTISSHSPDFHSAQNYIKTKIRDLCQGGVNRDYILNYSLPHADALVLSYEVRDTRHGGQRRVVSGFAILQKQSRYVYLDVICAKKVGQQILETIVQLARQWKIPMIQIASTSWAMPYWLKVGFVNHRSAPRWDPDLLADAPSVSSQKGLKSVDDALKNPVIQPYLKKLTQRKLGIKSSCRTVTSCASDGFVMVLDVQTFGRGPAWEKTQTANQEARASSASTRITVPRSRASTRITVPRSRASTRTTVPRTRASTRITVPRTRASTRSRRLKQ